MLKKPIYSTYWNQAFWGGFNEIVDEFEAAFGPSFMMLNIAWLSPMELRR